jgi:3-hydroxyisobutyrate dehydrogenase
MKTGFIGLGCLGEAMAKRLSSLGVDLVVWNRTRAKAEDPRLPVAESPAELVSAVDMLFINLFDSEAVSSVLTGEDGLREGDCKGKIIIDTTTNHFARVAGFYEALEEKGAAYLESPVLGSVVPASQGTLTVLVSGRKRPMKRRSR